MNGGTIWFAVALKVESRNAQYQNRGFSSPSLICFDQTREHPREFFSILFLRDDKTPGLFVVRGGSPACCFKQRSEILVAHGSIREGIRTPSLRYEIVYWIIGDGIHSFLLRRLPLSV